VATEDSESAKISKDGAHSTYSEGKSLLVVVVICEVAAEVWMRIGVRIAEAFTELLFLIAVLVAFMVEL